MRNRAEQILDQAIKRLKNGEEITSILLSCPIELREQLSANLNLVKTGLNLPKRIAPSPLKRKLYLRAQPQSRLSRIAEFLSVYALALPILIVVIAGAVSYAAAQSIPGDKLFAFKLSYEKLQLKLASNPEQQAKLQLTFANARLAEVEKTLADKNYTQTDQAIQELNTQTQAALNNIKQIAAANPTVKKDPGLINSVKSLADNQAQLINKVNQAAGPDAQIAASTKTTAENIQQLIATTNDQTTATIPVNTSIDVTGTVSALTDSSITIDKNVFISDSKTTVTDKDGNKILFSDLAIGDTVKIKGQLQNQSNLAQTVTLITKASSNIPANSSNNNSKSTPSSNTDNNQSDSTIQAKPQDVSGGFIPEAPANSGSSN